MKRLRQEILEFLNLTIALSSRKEERERERGEREKERERERDIDVRSIGWVPYTPGPGIEPTT